MSESTSLERIDPGMPVYGSDGEQLGAVEAVNPTGIRVASHDVPRAAVARVDQDGVHLQLAKVAFMARRDMDVEAASTGTGTGVATGTAASDDQIVIPLAEERLVIGTREIDLGEVIIRKRIVEEERMVPMTIRREELETVRRDANQLPAAGFTTSPALGAAPSVASSAGTTTSTAATAMPPAPAPVEDTATGGEDRLVFPLAEERLIVGTREVELGEVVLRKRVVEEEQMVPVVVRREELEVIRREPGQTLAAAEAGTGEEVIRIPLKGEETVVGKRPVVTREVIVNRDRQIEERQITDTVRREEIAVTTTYDEARPQLEQHFLRWQDARRAGGDATFRARDFSDVEGNYRAGFTAGQDARYAGREFDEVAHELRTGGATGTAGAGDEAAWEELREQLRAGFNSARGRHA
jgi:uncharacterized protein (TIGR02271 family)